MTARSYGHHCGLAHALDLVGQRWALLVVRELMAGPARYTDLQLGLPGIGPTVLATRLRQLEDRDVIQRRPVPPPYATTLYELTELGRELEPAVLSLASWGTRQMQPTADKSIFRARWAALALRARANLGLGADGLREGYEIHVDDETWHEELAGGRLVTGSGPPAAVPALIIHTDTMTAYQLATQRTSISDAVGRDLLRYDGELDALHRWSVAHGLKT